MKVKSNLLILCKIVVVFTLVWYLPTKVVDGVNIINARAQGDEETPVATPVSKDKKIHIYNTHQSEEYADYNVIEGANYLKDCLNNIGYACNVEGNNFEQYKSVNNIAYNQSYTVSKMYLEQSLASEGPYDMIIDFHRDSVAKDLSTLIHENVSYVKVMFVVGETSGKYESVNQTSEDLSARLNEKVPGISRGVYVKQSHYNQGISDNMVLIEVGAHENTKEEVMHTVELLSQVINEYLEG
ncbi:MAG: stage II sporulation protein P [Coprobacillaceae bacterium]